MAPEVLLTRRLVLSTPTENDVEAIHAACQDAAIQRFTTVPSPYLRTDAERFVGLTQTWWADGEAATWAIRLDDALVGMIGLARLASGGPEIGYWMAASARGRGVAREAATAVIDWAFAPERPHVQRIEWRAVVGNLGSARIAQRLGFRFEGTLRQALSNAFGRDDGWIAGLLRTDDRVPRDWPVDLG